MRRGRERRHPFIGAIRSGKIMQTAPTAAVAGAVRARHWSGRLRPTVLACTTWQETSGSGSRIATAIAMPEHPLTAHHGSLSTATNAAFAAAPGTAAPWTCARPTAAGTTPGPGILISASDSPGRSLRQEFYEIRLIRPSREATKSVSLVPLLHSLHVGNSNPLGLCRLSNMMIGGMCSTVVAGLAPAQWMQCGCSASICPCARRLASASPKSC